MRELDSKTQNTVRYQTLSLIRQTKLASTEQSLCTRVQQCFIRRMQYSVLIKWHSILRPKLNATPRHPPRRGSSYKLLPIAPPAVVSTIRHNTLNASLVNSTLDCIVSLYLHKWEHCIWGCSGRRKRLTFGCSISCINRFDCECDFC